MDKYFKRAGDLEEIERNSNNYFKVARDLEEEQKNTMVKSVKMYDDIVYQPSKEQIKKFLSNIVSGVIYDYESDRGTICSEGNVIISFERLQNMLESGDYNIISAQYYN